MTEPLGRWGAAVSLSIIVGLSLLVALAPQIGNSASLVAVLAAVLVAIGVAKRRPDLLQKR